MSEEIRIGQKMSEGIDIDSLIVTEGGDMYVDDIAVALRRPLPVARLFYAKLRRALRGSIQVEVYWNHFDNVITGVISGRDFETEVQFPATEMSRHDLVLYIDQFVERIKEAVSLQL